MRSADRGETWEKLDRGLPDPVIGAFEAMTMHHWPGGMMLVIGTATGEVYASEVTGDAAITAWTRIADAVMPVSKDDHYLPFLPPEARQRALAARAATV